MCIRIGFLHSLIRSEEKYLLEEIKTRVNVECIMIDDRKLSFKLGRKDFYADIILERCINHSRALHALRLFESLGMQCVNTSKVATICGDKLLTSITLSENGVPQPEVRVAFTEDSALQTIEDVGYPVVLKPAVGSWGRLLAKVNDRNAAEAILEHKKILGSYHHSIFYIQKYIPKNDRDIRAFVIGNKCVAAIYRNSEHWITNTARGADVTNCPVTRKLNNIAVRAGNAVGGGVVAVDLFEVGNEYLVNEVNYTMEFKNSIDTTGVDIPKLIIDYVIRVAKEREIG